MTVTPTVTITTTPIPQPTVNIKDWFYVLIVVLASAIGVSWYGIRAAVTRWGLRWALCGVIGGMLSYNYVALGLPGSQSVLREAGTLGVVVVALIGVFVGWGVGLIWRQLSGPATPRLAGERPSTGPKSQSS